jgi:hypothetical protein
MTLVRMERSPSLEVPLAGQEELVLHTLRKKPQYYSGLNRTYRRT